MSGRETAPPDDDKRVVPTTPMWRDTLARRMMAALALPVFWVLNRPSLQWFANAAYDFALRCNGVAVNFKGRHGLTRGEECFLRRHRASLAVGVLFDVGANHGAYAKFMHLLAPAARIYAFEPHPRTFAALRKNVVSPAVTLVNLALSDQAGQLRLYDFAATDGSTQASLSSAAVGLFAADMVEHEITCTTIDAFMHEHGIERIEFLKIDTEGFDINVLRGAKQALAERRIGIIQFEFIPANIAVRVTMRDFFDALPQYRIFRLCLNGSLLPLTPYNVKRCEIYVTHNLIALPA